MSAGVLPDGKVQLKLKTLWDVGTSHLLLTPSEFLEELAAIVAPLRAHLAKWGVVVAPDSPLRRKVILNSGVKKAARHKKCPEIKAGKAGDDEGVANGVTQSRITELQAFIEVRNTVCFLVEPAGFIGSVTGFSGMKFVHLFESFVQSTVVAPTTLRFREVSIHPPPEDGAAK